MTTFKTPSTSTPAFDRRDFRLHYTELNKAPQLTLDMLQASASPNFPILGDLYVASLLEKTTIERITAMGADPLRLNVPFQAMVERTARAAGLENLPMPKGLLARVKLWRRVILACADLQG